VLIVALALGGSLLVSYTRARGEGLGISYQGGVMARAERLVLLAVASLIEAWASPALGVPTGTVVLWTVAAIAVGSLGTALHRTVAIARALGRREADR